ncbi:MarR family transcriptional regulator [Nocardia sp. NPDC004860]|uniref:MarR family winged helix-turn-helix transcriptional regulator n=1 Tax=Nocardia sp. NPDC004860 TaxID=3154557 RepID=UPI0033BFA9D4
MTSATEPGESGDSTDERRAAVIGELDDVGRDSSTVAVMFHSAIAAKQGLGATDMKAIDLLQRHGPLTAKELGERSGLAPASVTGLVDRLERRGYLRRVPHPTDKRRILIELCEQPVDTELVPLFEDWAREVHSHYEDFSTEELETVIRFLRGSTARQRALAARLDAE